LALPFAGNAQKLKADILFRKLTKEVERRSYGSQVNRKRLYSRLVDNLLIKANDSGGNKKIILLHIIDKCRVLMIQQ
jgi:hypothetical protein